MECSKWFVRFMLFSLALLGLGVALVNVILAMSCITLVIGIDCYLSMPPVIDTDDGVLAT